MSSPVQASPPLRLDRSRHAAPQVFERLRQMILSLELAPGTVLSRAELAARFGVSQTPVRDALMRLGEEGLIDIFPQHATLVSQISLASVKQAHFLRLAIELEVVSNLADDADPALLEALRATVAAQRAALQARDIPRFSVLDHGFHLQMYEAAGVRQLWDMVRRISGDLDRLRRLHLPAEGKAQAIVRDHTELVDAIAKGDAAQAQRVLRRHLSGTLSQVEQIRRKHPEFVVAD
ncbi:GntR family transcriptional regulator [Piscinibacter sakaiensis]|uniref:GntR family transcriptional regulator n=1 Tax=Piscinibacter sakaiensis TaxID=1547922 RepID=UPI003AAB80D4